MEIIDYPNYPPELKQEVLRNLYSNPELEYLNSFCTMMDTILLYELTTLQKHHMIHGNSLWELLINGEILIEDKLKDINVMLHLKIHIDGTDYISLADLIYQHSAGYKYETVISDNIYYILSLVNEIGQSITIHFKHLFTE